MLKEGEEKKQTNRNMLDLDERSTLEWKIHLMLLHHTFAMLNIS